jgi:glycosyltransferase involved in cell wall biosynthesis
MKILRIYIKLPPHHGGMENHISKLTKIQNKSHEVTLYFNSGKNISERDKKIFPNYKTLDVRPVFLSFFIFYFGVIWELLFKKQKFDIVHLHGDWSSFVFASLIKRFTSAKVICFSMHGTIKTHSNWQKKILKYSLKPADIVFSTGFENHEWITSFCAKSVFQPSGVSDVFFKKSNLPIKQKDVFRIITVGNFFPVKNTKMIIEIASKLPDFEFNIIGDGREYDNLINDVKKLGCKNVVFKGYLSKEKIKNELLQSDLFLFTSFFEGTPTAIMESMACGLPIVSSNAGKVESIVKNNENGFVIQDYNIESYIYKIVELSNNQELYNKISDNNKLKARQFAWDIVSNSITTHQKQCLDSVLKMGKKGN